MDRAVLLAGFQIALLPTCLHTCVLLQVFPANATCENIKAATNMTLAVAFNCSADPNYAAKVIATAGSSPAINGKLAVEARTACCDAVSTCLFTLLLGLFCSDKCSAKSADLL